MLTKTLQAVKPPIARFALLPLPPVLQVSFLLRVVIIGRMPTDVTPGKKRAAMRLAIGLVAALSTDVALSLEQFGYLFRHVKALVHKYQIVPITFCGIFKGCLRVPGAS